MLSGLSRLHHRRRPLRTCGDADVVLGGRKRAGVCLPGAAGRPVCPLWGPYGWPQVTLLRSSRGTLLLGPGGGGAEGPWTARPQGRVQSQASLHPGGWTPGPMFSSAFLGRGRKAVEGPHPRSGHTQGARSLLVTFSDARTPRVVGGRPGGHSREERSWGSWMATTP